MADSLMPLAAALEEAVGVYAALKPHCRQIMVAGSIRRGRPLVKDIEIVADPRPYETGLFASGLATVVERWEKVKGALPCKYTQRVLPSGTTLDLFLAEPETFGLILAYRTGSANWVPRVLGKRWVEMGYKSVEGRLTRKIGGRPVPVRTERELFDLLDMPYVSVVQRETREDAAAVYLAPDGATCCSCGLDIGGVYSFPVAATERQCDGCWGQGTRKAWFAFMMEQEQALARRATDIVRGGMEQETERRKAAAK